MSICTRASPSFEARDLGNECPVDLEGVDGQLTEIGERRVAGAKVVDRNVDAEVLEREQALARTVHAVDEEPLGDLERDITGVDVRGVQGVAHMRDECSSKQLTRRHVHLDREARMPPVPLARLFACLGDDPAGDTLDYTFCPGGPARPDCDAPLLAPRKAAP